MPVSVWAVLAGDAYKVLEAAIAKGNDDPEKIAEWLKQLKELPTLSGKMGFDEKGRANFSRKDALKELAQNK